MATEVASNRQQPVNGIVQPPYIPDPARPHYVSNNLQFLKNVVLEEVWNHKSAWPFHRPVDAATLNLLDYYDIITRPMDLGTIKKRLENFWYNSADDCIEDFKTMFNNCYTYNDPEHQIITMARALEELFRTKISDLPAEHAVPVPVPAVPVPEETVAIPAPAVPQRRSTARVQQEVRSGVVQPPCVPEASKPHRNTNQLQYLLDVVMKAIWEHRSSWPFHYPVDAAALNLPDYHEVISTPMDLSTVKKRLKNCWYYTASECIHDYQTIFNNCYTYNDPDHEVVNMAQSLEELFRRKLSEMPTEEIEIAAPAEEV